MFPVVSCVSVFADIPWTLFPVATANPLILLTSNTIIAEQKPVQHQPRLLKTVQRFWRIVFWQPNQCVSAIIFVLCAAWIRKLLCPLVPQAKWLISVLLVLIFMWFHIRSVFIPLNRTLVCFALRCGSLCRWERSNHTRVQSKATRKWTQHAMYIGLQAEKKL